MAGDLINHADIVKPPWKPLNSGLESFKAGEHVKGWVGKCHAQKGHGNTEHPPYLHTFRTFFQNIKIPLSDFWQAAHFSGPALLCKVRTACVYSNSFLSLSSYVEEVNVLYFKEQTCRSRDSFQSQQLGDEKEPWIWSTL